MWGRGRKLKENKGTSKPSENKDTALKKRETRAWIRTQKEKKGKERLNVRRRKREGRKGGMCKEKEKN